MIVATGRPEELVRPGSSWSYDSDLEQAPSPAREALSTLRVRDVFASSLGCFFQRLIFRQIIQISCVYIYIYIILCMCVYIYIYREREIYTHMHIYIYT